MQTATAVAPPLPTVAYKPSADCTYSQLVNRIQGAQQKQEDKNNSSATIDQQQQMQQYYQYYYATQYYEYYKQMMQQYPAGFSMENLQGKIHLFLVARKAVNQFFVAYLKEQNLDQNQQNQYIAFYSQYMQQQPTNPYAQIVTNVQQTTEVTTPKTTAETTTITKKTVLSSLVQNYGSDSDDDDEENDVEGSEAEERTVIRTPPTEICLVIDKMASYVAKNGADFEAIVKAKGDARFEFLNETHEFYAYYKSKIKEFGVKEEPQEKKEEPQQVVVVAAAAAAKSSGNKPKKVIGRLEKRFCPKKKD